MDRFFNEGRILPVAAYARGEITEEQFERILYTAYTGSRWTADIRHLPFSGSTLETLVATIVLSGETETCLMENSFSPLLAGWKFTSDTLGLPGYGSTGIGNGSFEFLELTSSPAEISTEYQNRRVIVPPATGTIAGTLGHKDTLALYNLRNVYEASGDDFDSEYGWPNYLDFDSGLNFALDDPLYGTLEICQMEAALLNYLLGGHFYEELLRTRPNWDMALNAYYKLIDVDDIRIEATDDTSGANEIITRTGAHQEQVIYLRNLGDQASFTFSVDTLSVAVAWIYIAYSNDDTGVGDALEISLDGVAGDTLTTLNTKNFFLPDTVLGWNFFVGSTRGELCEIAPGDHELSIKLIETDSYGVNLDVVFLAYDSLCPLVSTTELEPSFFVGSNFPNPFTTATRIPLVTEQSIASFRLDVLDPLGRIQTTLHNGYLPAGRHEFLWEAGRAMPGMYYYHVTVENYIKTTPMLLLQRN